jgi:hypothetical protein
MLAVALPGVAWAAPGDTTMLSAICPHNPFDGSYSISGDGRSVVADCFVPHHWQVCVRGLVSGNTVLASRASGASGVQGNRDSESPSISADGRFVAFTSLATNFSPAAGGRGGHVFVRDVRANTTSLVSRRTGRRGAAIRTARFGAPSISGDGRFVAFQAGGNIFVRDRGSDTTTLASRASGAAGVKGNRESRFPSISAEGRRVAFESDASNLTPGDHSPYTDVFVRDLATHTTIPVSQSASLTANGFSGSPAIAADGSSVAFRSSGGIPRVTAVFERNLVTQVTVLVSRASGADGALATYGRDIHYAISGDGQRVALGGRSNNLTADDTDLVRDVFVRDLGVQTTTLVSRASGPDGAKGNANSGDVSISTDGLLLLFASNATNLTPGDQNGGLFLRELAPPS